MRNPIIVTSWLVWGVLLSMIGVYTAMVTLILKPQESEGPTAILLTVLYGAAAADILVGLLIRAFLRRSIRKTNGEKEWGGRYFGMALVIWALAEAIAVYGLVAFLIGAPLSTYFIFAGLSAVAMLVNMPALLIPKKADPTVGPLGNVL